MIDGQPAEVALISSVLERFGRGALQLARARDIRIVVLQAGDTFAARSRVLLQADANVDGWPTPPAGLFVVAERTVYLRSLSTMTIAHEFGHALDCALGNGGYWSSQNPHVRRAYAVANDFVTPYAGCGLDEYFAESMRAWVEANDPHAFWPPATRARLTAIDPTMAHIMRDLFTREFATHA
jgi:hypothetical protein